VIKEYEQGFNETLRDTLEEFARSGRGQSDFIPLEDLAGPDEYLQGIEDAQWHISMIFAGHTKQAVSPEEKIQTDDVGDGPPSTSWPHDRLIRLLTDDEVNDKEHFGKYEATATRSGRKLGHSIRGRRPGDYFVVTEDILGWENWTSKYDRILDLMENEPVIFLEQRDIKDLNLPQTFINYCKNIGSNELFVVQAFGGRVGLIQKEFLTTPWYAEGETYPSCFRTGLPPLFPYWRRRKYRGLL
jgi:hypothetical protein